MPINLAVVFGHSLSAGEICSFPQQVSSSAGMRHSAEQLWQVMRPRWDNLGALDEFSTFAPRAHRSEEEVKSLWNNGDAPSFHWAGFSLYFEARTVHAFHLEKFAGFAFDMCELQRPLQDCARALALALRSPAIVYGADTGPFQAVLSETATEGMTEILSILYATCGPPAVNIRDTVNEHESGGWDFGDRCYFVEKLDAY